jgi:hypothetical protein
MNPDIVLLVTDASDLVGRYCASRSVSEVEVLPGLILSSGMIVTSGRILASGAGVSSRVNVHSVLNGVPSISQMYDLGRSHFLVVCHAELCLAACSRVTRLEMNSSCSSGCSAVGNRATRSKLSIQTPEVC